MKITSIDSCIPKASISKLSNRTTCHVSKGIGIRVWDGVMILVKILMLPVNLAN